MSTRLIIFFLILVCIDVLAFQAVRQLILTSGKSVRLLTYILYWSVPVISIVYITGMMMGWAEHLAQRASNGTSFCLFYFLFHQIADGGGDVDR